MKSDLVMSFGHSLYAQIWVRGWFTFDNGIYEKMDMKRFRDVWWGYSKRYDRWVIMDSPFIGTASVGYYCGSYSRLDGAIDTFRRVKDKPYTPYINQFEDDQKKRFWMNWQLWHSSPMIINPPFVI